MPDRLLGLNPDDFGTTGLTLGMLIGIAATEPQRVVDRSHQFGRGGGNETVLAWRTRAVQELLRRHGIDLDTPLVKDPAPEPEAPAAPEPKLADPIDPKPGDIWHDVCPSFTGGQFWHARDDGNGGVELYEKDGTAVIRASQVASMRGGMTLIHRQVTA